MISFSHVYKTYPGSIHALKDINLVIEKGEFIFITGPSGAGKTTLFRLLSAYDKPTSGQVNVAGCNVGSAKAQEIAMFRRRIGVIYQDFKLLKDRDVLENVKLPLEIRREKSSYIQARATEVLELVGLAHKRKQFPEQLSGGEQQRVAIARALVHHPGVLIADEPTGNLDPDLCDEIMSLLESVNAQGTTVFVATHDHDLVKKWAKRRIEIKAGQIKVAV